VVLLAVKSLINPRNLAHPRKLVLHQAKTRWCIQEIYYFQHSWSIDNPSKVDIKGKGKATTLDEDAINDFEDSLLSLNVG
jgi:hypothetical protein